MAARGPPRDSDSLLAFASGAKARELPQASPLADAAKEPLARTAGTSARGRSQPRVFSLSSGDMSDFDLGAMMRQAQQLREQMEYMQKGLENETVEGSAAGGRVKVKATGGQRIVSVEIDPSALSSLVQTIRDGATTSR